jgi:hypothetical protein
MAKNTDGIMTVPSSKKKIAADEAPVSAPQTTPKDIGFGHPEYQFVQSIMEMQKSLGEINASIKTLNASVSSTNGKVDDLVKWKNMILGGAVVIGFAISGTYLLVSKASDYLTLSFKNQENIQPQPKDQDANSKTIK